MAVLSMPTEWALGSFGSSWSDLHHDAPALMLLVMTFSSVSSVSSVSVVTDALPLL
jgi:hypothetical protein